MVALLAISLSPGHSGAFPPGGNAQSARGPDAVLLEQQQEAFEEALDAEPGSAAARAGLARTLAARAQIAFSGGDWPAARELVDRAAELEPGLAWYRLLLGQILLALGDPAAARRETLVALELEPRNPQAHELLGSIHYQGGHLDLAVAEWEAALPESRNAPLLTARIERARRELKVEAGFGRESSRHFTLLFEGQVSREISELVTGRLEEAYERLSDELGAAPAADLTVILYSSQSFQDVTNAPRWSGGVYDGKIRLPVGGLSRERDADRLRPILAHETTHAFLRALVPQGLPLWFEEGLAMYFQGATAEEAAGYLKGHEVRFANLQEVTAALQGRGEDVRAGYYGATLAVRTLIDEEGFGAVRDLLAEMRRGEGFAAALESEARLSVEELQEHWSEALP
jgi:hypothetical protein